MNPVGFSSCDVVRWGKNRVSESSGAVHFEFDWVLNCGYRMQQIVQILI